MKWLLILFATYMLVLPCIPCNAAEVCCAEEEACATAAPCSGEAEEHSCPEEEGVCSEDIHYCPGEKSDQHEHSATCPCCPSFSCNTCHSIVVSGLVAAIPIMPEIVLDNIPFTDKPLAHFPAIIWQPPKALC